MSMHLPRQIEQLKQRVLFFGSLVERAIAKAVVALARRDVPLAHEVIHEDDEIDRMEVDIEEECLKILALYQPVAKDLRFVVAVLKINNDLERMADLARNIAKRVAFLARVDAPELNVDFSSMAARAQDMVKRSLDALVKGDAELAESVRSDDDTLDSMRREAHEQIRQALRTQPERIEALLKLYSVAKHLERLGDMATNVAEDVIYMVHGQIVRHHDNEA